MSLIADALQKANISSPDSPPPSPRSPRPTWIYWTAGLFGLTLILWVRSSSQFSSSSVTASTPTTAAASSQPTGLNLLRIAEGQWRLSGIVQGGNGKPLALLNGHVVEEGQPIQGSKVVRVASNEVDVETDGKIRTLKLR